MTPRSAVSSGFERPIAIEYQDPAWLGILLLILPVGAVLAVVFTDFSWAVRSLLIVVILVYWLVGVFSGSPGVKQGVSPVFVLNQRDEWRVITGTGEGEVVTLGSACVLGPGLIILRLFSRSKMCFNLIVTRHCMDPGAMRRLRVRLRYKLNAGK